VIEGFYGQPWTAAVRREVVEFLAPRGMNAYVYAPKHDPFHRDRWRESPPPDEVDTLHDLAAECASAGVRFGFCLSPGLDFDGTDADHELLWKRLEPSVEAGVDWLVLAFDDIEMPPEAGGVHAEASARVLDQLRARHPDGHLSVVPTDYVGSRPTPYLDALVAGLPDDVDVMWTGRTIVSPTISTEEASARRDASGGHPVLIWDNYPVNDGIMKPALHLGPLTGRDADLADAAVGLLANPMPQGRASLVALATAMAYAVDPASYDPATAWDDAVSAVAERHDAPWLRSLALACSSSALTDPTSLDLHRLIDADDLDAIRSRMTDSRRDAAAIRAAAEAGAPLAVEVQPWAEQMEREAVAGLEAVEVLSGGRRDERDVVLHSMVMVQTWHEARSGPRIAFGPRLACYPALVQAGDTLAVDPDGVVVEGGSAIDRLCRQALARLGRAA